MKTLSKYLILVMLLSPIAQLPLKAEEAPVTNVHSENLDRNAAEKATMARLKAIQELAKTKLSKSEKKALREELKAMKSKQRPGGVIYISTGALIIIIILLIILL
jgi:hypothetical protein